MSEFQIQVKAGDRVLTRFHNMIGALDDHAARKVMARALNRTGGPTLTQVRHALVEQTSADPTGIKKAVVGKKAWAGRAAGEGKLYYIIEASGRHIPLRYFSPAEVRGGSNARVWGGRQFYHSAFMKGGQRPNRVPLGGRLTFGNGKEVWVRSGPFDRSNGFSPIRRMWGPAVPKELVRGESAAYFKLGTFRLEKDLEHELKFWLSKNG